MGWNAVKIWECEIETKASRKEILNRLYNQISLPDRAPCEEQTHHWQIAADSSETYGDLDCFGCRRQK